MILNCKCLLCGEYAEQASDIYVAVILMAERRSRTEGDRYKYSIKRKSRLRGVAHLACIEEKLLGGNSERFRNSKTSR